MCELGINFDMFPGKITFEGIPVEIDYVNEFRLSLSYSKEYT